MGNCCSERHHGGGGGGGGKHGGGSRGHHDLKIQNPYKIANRVESVGFNNRLELK